jgi:glucose-6-phosphate dehydrogenase assembly protein OpcA
MAASVSEDVWSAQDTSGAEIEAGLRELLRARHAESEGFVPARVLNLIVVVDREWRGEVANRLERVGRYNASRTVLCCLEPGRDTLDARATMSFADDVEPGALAVLREQVELDLGPQHLEHLDTIVDPILVSELPTLVWSPHGHTDAVDALLRLAHVVLLDSVEEPDLKSALDRVAELAEHAYVVDLAWLRSTPWRERLSAAFDPPARRAGLGQISAITVRHQPESGAAALLLVGWLASRLGWRSESLMARDGSLQGRAHARRQDVAVRLERQDEQGVPGLAGVSVELASGESFSLDRAPGGLAAERRTRDGSESRWTVLGASRGEGGILGEGVRQALLRDPTYGPALASARAMVP